MLNINKYTLPNTRILSGHLSMLIFSVLVSMSFVLGAKVSNEISPLAITGARVLLASILIATLFFSKSGFSFSDLRSPWRFFVLGSMMSLYFVLMFEGLKTATPLSMSVIYSLTPIMAGFFDLLLAKRKMTKPVLCAVALGAAGAIWVIFDGNLGKLLQLRIGRGELLFIVGCAGHALYAALIPRLNRGESPLSQTFGTLMACTLILGIVGYGQIIKTDWFTLSSFVWSTILYLAIFATAASFFLIQFSARRLSSVKVMAYTYAIPFWVVCILGFFEKDWPSLDLLFGGIAIALALIFLLINKEY